MVLNSLTPIMVAMPMSSFLVAAMSKRQDLSSPHISLALRSSSGSSKEGVKAGVKEVSTKASKLSPALL